MRGREGRRTKGWLLHPSHRAAKAETGQCARAMMQRARGHPFVNWANRKRAARGTQKQGRNKHGSRPRKAGKKRRKSRRRLRGHWGRSAEEAARLFWAFNEPRIPPSSWILETVPGGKPAYRRGARAEQPHGAVERTAWTSTTDAIQARSMRPNSIKLLPIGHKALDRSPLRGV